MASLREARNKRVSTCFTTHTCPRSTYRASERNQLHSHRVCKQSEGRINIFILSSVARGRGRSLGERNRREREREGIFRSRAEMWCKPRRKSIGKFARSDGTTRLLGEEVEAPARCKRKNRKIPFPFDRELAILGSCERSAISSRE